MIDRSEGARLSQAITEHVRRYWDMKATVELGGDLKNLQIQRGIVRGLVMSWVLTQESTKSRKDFTRRVIEKEKDWIENGRPSK